MIKIERDRFIEDATVRLQKQLAHTLFGPSVGYNIHQRETCEKLVGAIDELIRQRALQIVEQSPTISQRIAVSKFFDEMGAPLAMGCLNSCTSQDPMLCMATRICHLITPPQEKSGPLINPTGGFAAPMRATGGSWTDHPMLEADKLMDGFDPRHYDVSPNTYYDDLRHKKLTHIKRGNEYEITGFAWDATADEWAVQYIRTKPVDKAAGRKQSPRAYTRLWTDFFGYVSAPNTVGGWRFTEVS
jgi:hypothetical protein